MSHRANYVFLKNCLGIFCSLQVPIATDVRREQWNELVAELPDELRYDCTQVADDDETKQQWAVAREETASRLEGERLTERFLEDVRRSYVGWSCYALFYF